MPFYFHNMVGNEPVNIFRSDVFYDFSLQELMLNCPKHNQVHYCDGQAVLYQVKNRDAWNHSIH